VLRNPPGGKDLGKVYLSCPWSPLGFKLSRYVPDSDLQELTGHTHNSPRRKSVPDAGYGVVADSVVRKRRAFVRICLVLVGGLFGTDAVLYTSN
jgi:hypothetical protein